MKIFTLRTIAPSKHQPTAGSRLILPAKLVTIPAVVFCQPHRLESRVFKQSRRPSPYVVENMLTPELKARENIDCLLSNVTVRNQSDANVLAYRGLAIRGFADYLPKLG